MCYFPTSIYDMQIEKDFFYHCNNFVHVQNYEKVFRTGGLQNSVLREKIRQNVFLSGKIAFFEKFLF